MPVNNWLKLCNAETAVYRPEKKNPTPYGMGPKITTIV